MSKIKMSLKDWNLDDWVNMVADAIKVKVTRDGTQISLDMELPAAKLEKVLKKIIIEAFQGLFEDKYQFNLIMTPKGVGFQCEWMSKPFILDWDQAWIEGGSIADIENAFVKAMDDYRKEAESMRTDTSALVAVKQRLLEGGHDGKTD